MIVNFQGICKKLHIEKAYINFLVFSMLAGILIYLTFISNQLTNHYDGLWSDPWYESGKWELSIGRWFWLFLDRFRVGYAADPFNSYLALFFFSMGNMLLADIFSLIGKIKAYLVSVMILSSTTISVFLSYRYMSPTFGLSYLLSIGAVWVLYKQKNTIISVIVSSGMICLSLGLYQANLGCTCLMIISVVLFLCSGKYDTKDIFKFIIKCVVSMIIACLVYKILWDIAMKIYHVEQNPYNGASRVSIPLIFQKMPARIMAAYSQFYKYFFENSIKHNIFQQYKVFIVFLFVAFIVLLWKGCEFLKHREWIRFVIYLSGIIVIPVACNVSMILAPESGFLIQQTAAMAILFPVILCLVSRLFSGMEIKCGIVKYSAIGISLFILYGNIYMTATDLEAMYEGTVSSDAIIDHVVQTLINDDLYSEEREYIFIGQISDNPMFRTTILWDRANSYARYGEFWTGGSVMRMAYNGLLRRGGVNLPLAQEDVFESYRKLEQIAGMPCYPLEGSIRDIDGYIVVKISDRY